MLEGVGGGGGRGESNNNTFPLLNYDLFNRDKRVCQTGGILYGYQCSYTKMTSFSLRCVILYDTLLADLH